MSAYTQKKMCTLRFEYGDTEALAPQKDAPTGYESEFRSSLTKTMYAVSGSTKKPFESNTTRKTDEVDQLERSRQASPPRVRRGRSLSELHIQLETESTLQKWHLGYSDDELDNLLPVGSHVMADTVQKALTNRY